MALRIVDSHVHFWNPDELHFGWLADLPALNQPILPDHVPLEGPGWVSDALVFVQADCLPEEGITEAAWVSELAQEDTRIQGIVAFAPLESPDATQTLEALQAYPLVKGVRRLIQSEGSGFCLQPAFVESVQALPRYGYSFDLCIRHYQLPDVIALVGQCPDVSFVLDHIGKPDIKAGLLDPWYEHIKALAQFPNVSCKLSGLVTEADVDMWQPMHLTPYIDHVLETFGPARVMFGSDSPVLRLAHLTYEGWIKVALAALQALSESELQQIFGDNARRFYRLEQML
jgi:L-fuconolactonase